MSEPKVIYLIGSLRNPEIPVIATRIREAGFEVFSDWFGGGPEADDRWKENELAMGRTHGEALRGYLAQNTFALDERHLDRCDAAVMAMPAGKSAHAELGYVIGQGKPGWILFPGEPATDDRWDVMHRFAFKHGGGLAYSVDELLPMLCQRRDCLNLNPCGICNKDKGPHLYTCDPCSNTPEGTTFILKAAGLE